MSMVYDEGIRGKERPEAVVEVTCVQPEPGSQITAHVRAYYKAMAAILAT